MKKLTILFILFFAAFYQPVTAQTKKVIVLNKQHDARYKNNGPILGGHQDNGNHKNRGVGNRNLKKNKTTHVIVPGTIIVGRNNGTTRRAIAVRKNKKKDD